MIVLKQNQLPQDNLPKLGSYGKQFDSSSLTRGQPPVYYRLFHHGYRATSCINTFYCSTPENSFTATQNRQSKLLQYLTRQTTVCWSILVRYKLRRSNWLICTRAGAQVLFTSVQLPNSSSEKTTRKKTVCIQTLLYINSFPTSSEPLSL
jgi:hypothetical protein